MKKNIFVISLALAAALYAAPQDTQDSSGMTGLDSARNASFMFNPFGFSSEPANGVQLGIFVTYAGRAYVGTQAATLGNIVADDMLGIQFAGIANIAAGNFYGLQAAPMFNYATNFKGTQVAAINTALRGSGVQAATINVSADSLDGIQFGVINIGGHVGRQIGLINISGKSDKSPIGLINIVGNGIFDATVYVDETGRNGATLHLGTPYFYTLFEYASDFGFDWPMSWGLGMGTRFGKWGNFWSLDYSFSNSYDSNPHNFSLGSNPNENDVNHLQKIRLGGTYKLLPGLGISSGLTFNALSEVNGEELYIEPKGEYHWHWTFGKHKVRLWPGLYAGFTVGKF